MDRYQVRYLHAGGKQHVTVTYNNYQTAAEMARVSGGQVTDYGTDVGIVHVAVIEMDGDVLEPPAVFVGATYQQVAQRAADYLWDHRDGICEPADDNPFTPPADLDTPKGGLTVPELVEWHHTFRNATTVPWVTFYERDLPAAD